jgi:hypothetical protein
MMDQLFFTCEWNIDPSMLRMLWEAMDTAAELGCTIFSRGTVETSKGIFIHTFIIQTPSTKILSEFVEKAGKQGGLTNWYLVTREQDLDGAWNISLPINRGKLMESFLRDGQINESRRKNMTNDEAN